MCFEASNNPGVDSMETGALERYPEIIDLVANRESKYVQLLPRRGARSTRSSGLSGQWGTWKKTTPTTRLGH